MVIAGWPLSSWLLLAVAVGAGTAIELLHWLRRRRELDDESARS